MSEDNYIIPFRDLPVAIIQGYGGQYSHFKIREHTDYTYALDFALPVDTPIIAARAGRIHGVHDREVKSYTGLDLAVGRTFPPNHIMIGHEDGTLATYAHLDFSCLEELGLQKGQAVEQGQIIGRSGLSGWIGPLPHLHFMVHEYVELGQGHRRFQTVQTEFTNYSGPMWHKDLLPT